MEEKFMKAAIKQAMIAYENGDVPVGAVIVKENKIIARAYNKKEKTRNATDHAEIIAIKKACRQLKDWRLNDCIMYVTLKPCSMCIGAIHQARIKKVIYGAEPLKEKESECFFARDDLSTEKCGEILKSFFQNRRKT